MDLDILNYNESFQGRVPSMRKSNFIEGFLWLKTRTFVLACHKLLWYTLSELADFAIFRKDV